MILGDSYIFLSKLVRRQAALGQVDWWVEGVLHTWQLQHKREIRALQSELFQQAVVIVVKPKHVDSISLISMQICIRAFRTLSTLPPPGRSIRGSQIRGSFSTRICLCSSWILQVTAEVPSGLGMGWHGNAGNAALEPNMPGDARQGKRPSQEKLQGR